MSSLNKQSINPITFRTKDLHVTFAHIGMSDGTTSMPDFHVVISVPPVAAGQPTILAHASMFEREFLNGIGHLFPAGELQHVHHRPSGGPQVPNPVGEIPLGKAEPCNLGVGQLELRDTLAHVVLLPRYFGQDDRTWDPTPEQEARINAIHDDKTYRVAVLRPSPYIEMPNTPTTRNVTVLVTASADVNALATLGTKLPGLAAQILDICKEQPNG